VRSRVVALLLIVTAAAPLLPQGAAQPAAEPSTAAREAELAQVRDQISRLVTQLDELSVRAFGFQGALEKVALERRIQERRVAEAGVELALAESRATEASRRLERFENDLAREREKLESRLAGLYRIGRHGQLRLAFAIDPDAEPLPAVRLLRYLARRDAASIERFEELRGKVALERRELERRRDESAELYGQQTARRDELRRIEARQAALLGATRREGAAIADRALELASRESQLASLLDSLYGRATAGVAGRPIQEFKGHLGWPVTGGRVKTGFGPRLDPRYGTRVPHHGVDLDTVPGARVVAIYPGRVVFAAPFQGYGPTVIVQHAGRVFTLYAGLDSISVARDALVSLRQSLGSAASALYFEIRVENRPEDPEAWIR
jgi:septal ring factor EnvC (AmiA/AmiB activator)